MNLEASIIIPTYNRSKNLHILVEKLKNQNFKNFEVIFLNDGSTDDTEETLKSFTSSIESLTIINKKNEGHSKTRNLGADLAKTNLLIFLDDDMLPDENWVESHVIFHKKKANTILVGYGFRSAELAKNDFEKYLIEVEKKWMPKESEFKVTATNFMFTSQNISLSKDLFLSLGKFSELVLEGEDFYLGQHALKKNIDIYYNANVRAYHSDGVNLERFALRLNQYKKSHIRLCKLNPEFTYIFNPKKTGKTKASFKNLIDIILNISIIKNTIHNSDQYNLPFFVKCYLFNLYLFAKVK